MIGYLKSHWDGKQSLIRSFWINYMLVNIVVGLAASMTLLVMAGDGSTAFIPRFLLNYYLIYFVIAIWQAVGVYRAANAYALIKQKWFFPWVAKVFTLMSAGKCVLSIISLLMLNPEGQQQLIDQVQKLALYS